VIILRTATEHDLQALVEMVEDANAESRFVGQVDIESAREYLREFIIYDDREIVVADDNGEVIGAIILAVSKEFWTQPLCYVIKFWVLPEGRRTNAARLLLDYIFEYAQDHDCLAVYSTATAELEDREQRLFVNLLKRNGFRDCGPTMKASL